ncbi:MAG: sulfatase-like hydrolase/transferase [Cytophagales bacterium]|nr:sulfatase-like hydrolase/transferase [Cytophagales bacterium]
MKTILLLTIAFLYAYCLNAQVRRPADKPNYILIVADDLGFADLSINGSKQIKTPNIDALAHSGVRFTEGYVSSSVCSPSRAGLLTGRNQVEFGQDNNLDVNQPGFDPEYLGLPVSEKTIGNYLKPLGYVSGLIGKWHLGDASQFHPLNRGFDEFWGYTGGGHHYFKSLPDGKGYLSPIECNFKTPEPITYITDDKGDECVDFIKRHKDRPFFLYASFNAPHAPMHATEQDLKRYGHIADEKRRAYAAMVHRLDVNVGKIMKTIEENGLRENTIVVFISDNGGPVNSNASINAPYNGQKGILLEGGIHVPFIINWPGTIPGGITYDKPISTLDLAPTFVELSGGESKQIKFSGVNLMPYVLNKNSLAPHEELKWRFTISAAIRQGDWKLIRVPDRLPMLYHLPSDISEQKNVALDNIEKTNELLKKLGQWDVTLPHPVFLEGAIWKKRQLDLYDSKYQLTQPE